MPAPDKMASKISLLDQKNTTLIDPTTPDLSMTPDVLLGMSDADSVTTANNGEMRLIGSEGLPTYDAVESDHKERVFDPTKGQYTEQPTKNPLDEIQASRAKRKVQPQYVANVLGKDISQLTEQDYVDVANQQQIQALSDMVNGDNAWKAPLIRGVESTNLTGKYVDENGNPVDIPLDIDITSNNRGTGYYGRTLGSVGTVDNINTTDIAAQDPNQNVYVDIYKTPDKMNTDKLDFSWIAENNKGNFDYYAPEFSIMDTAGSLGSGVLQAASYVSKAPKNLYEFLGGDYLEGGSTYDKSVKAIIDTMNQGGEYIDEFNKKYVAPNDYAHRKLMHDLSKEFDDGNYFSGILNSVVENPQGTLGLAAEAYTLSKAMVSKGITKAPLFFSMAIDSMEQAKDEFKKTHGREPNTKELGYIAALSFALTSVDFGASEFILGKGPGKTARDKVFKGVEKLVDKAFNVLPENVVGTIIKAGARGSGKVASIMGVEALQEGPIQQGLQELAGKQDKFDITDKEMLKDIYLNAVGGAIAGPGMSGINIAVEGSKKVLPAVKGVLPNKDDKYEYNESVTDTINKFNEFKNNKEAKDIATRIKAGENVTQEEKDVVIKPLEELVTSMESELKDIPPHKQQPIIDKLVMAKRQLKMLNGESQILNNRPVDVIEKDIITESSKEQPDVDTLIRLNIEKQISEVIGNVNPDQVHVGKGTKLTKQQAQQLKFYGGSIGGIPRTGLLEYVDELLTAKDGTEYKQGLINRLKHFADTQNKKLDAFKAAEREFKNTGKEVRFTIPGSNTEYVFNDASRKGFIEPLEKEYKVFADVLKIANGEYKIPEKSTTISGNKNPYDMTVDELLAEMNTIADKAKTIKNKVDREPLRKRYGELAKAGYDAAHGVNPDSVLSKDTNKKQKSKGTPTEINEQYVEQDGSYNDYRAAKDGYKLAKGVDNEQKRVNEQTQTTESGQQRAEEVSTGRTEAVKQEIEHGTEAVEKKLLDTYDDMTDKEKDEVLDTLEKEKVHSSVIDAVKEVHKLEKENKQYTKELAGLKEQLLKAYETRNSIVNKYIAMVNAYENKYKQLTTKGDKIRLTRKINKAAGKKVASRGKIIIEPNTDKIDNLIDELETAISNVESNIGKRLIETYKSDVTLEGALSNANLSDDVVTLLKKNSGCE